MKKADAERGFTLVELAIVLMIIGLLIGGILRGQELIENARINATIQQAKAYTGAVVTFQDAYSAFPGDMANATTRVPGCNATTHCSNGNGNGVLGTPVPYQGSIAGVNTSINQIGTGVPAIETTLFWKHLALAHMISGVQSNADPATASWGETHPAGKINGGFVVFFSSANTADFGYGHVLRLQSGPNAMTSSGAGLMPISPIRARQLDQKADDGMPDRGDITADFDNSNCDSAGVYQRTESLNCVLYFKL